MKLENAGAILLDMPSGATLEVWDYNLGAAFAKVFLNTEQLMRLFKNQAVTPLGVEVFALDRLGYQPIPEPVPDDAYQIVADLLEHVRREFVTASEAWEVKKNEVSAGRDQRYTLEYIPTILGAIEAFKRSASFVEAQIASLRLSGREPGPFREATIDELIEKLTEKADYCRFESDRAKDDAERRYHEGKEEAYNDLCNFLRRASKSSTVAQFAPWGNFLHVTRRMNVDFWKEWNKQEAKEHTTVIPQKQKAKADIEQPNLFENEG